MAALALCGVAADVAPDDRYSASLSGEWIFNKTPSSNPNSIYYRRNWGRVKALMIRGYRANDFSDIRPFTLGQEGLNPTARYTYPIFLSSLSANSVFDRNHDDEWADLFAD